jgi:hypothetical protein
MTFFVTFPRPYPSEASSCLTCKSEDNVVRIPYSQKGGIFFHVYEKEVAEIEHLIQKQVRDSFDGLGWRKLELVEMKAT